MPKSAIVYDDEHNYLGGVLSEHLARNGSRVVHVTPHALVSAWTDMTLEQTRIVSRLHSLGVAMRTATAIGQIEGGRVHVTSAATGDSVGVLEADAILLVTARLPKDQLYVELLGVLPAPGQLGLAGDANAPGIIQAAVLSGHTMARRIIDGPESATVFKRERPILQD